MASWSAVAASNKELPPWGCDSYTPQSAKLLQEWLSAQGLPPQKKLALEPVPSGGRGLVARTNIRKGERLLYVPSKLIITTDSEWSDSEAGSILLAGAVPDWPLLATYLISEASQGLGSQWSAYISALPRQPESILLWTENEISEYLAATSIIGQAGERVKEVESTYHDLYSSIFTKHPQLFPAKIFTLQNFKWAFGILFSRLVRLQSLNQKVALVPWADMLNHSSQVHASLDFDVSSEAVLLTTDRAYQPSEQVFITYGSKSKGELLLSYGFVSQDTAETDSVDLQVALKLDDEMFTAKLKALTEHGLSSTCRYPITLDGLPEQLVAFARLAVCPLSMSSQFSQLAASAASKETSAYIGPETTRCDVPLDVDIQAHGLILYTVEVALSKLAGFLKDYGTDRDGNTAKGKQKRSAKAKIACTLCESEQTILFRAQYVLRSKLRKLRTQRASHGNNSSGFELLYGLGKLFK